MTIMQCGIYRIRLIGTDRCYIGQSVNFTRRWNAHRRHLTRGDHHNPHLIAAWHAYGADAFVFEPILFCHPEHLNLYEQRALDLLKPEFNWAKIASSRRGVPQSAEARAKNGAAHRGRKRSPEVCARLSQANTGKRHSPEAREKMRLAKLGKKHSVQSRANMSVGQVARDRPSSEYDSRRGRKRPPEVVAKSAATRTGAKRTPEMRARMSEARYRFLAQQKKN